MRVARRTNYDRKIRCYDCNEHVYDIQEHRKTCEKSRKAKSAVGPKKKNKKSHSSEGTTDFYMLIDVSTSMTGARLANAKSSLLEIEGSMKDDDRIAVITFDTQAFFKLKPRPVEQIRRQQEMQPLMDRIFAKGATAIWDAIYMGVSQLRDKNKKTLMIVLTDGEDNSSKHTYAECLALVQGCPGVTLSIIHIDGVLNPNEQYKVMSQEGRGDYVLVEETEITITIRSVFKKFYV